MTLPPQGNEQSSPAHGEVAGTPDPTPADRTNPPQPKPTRRRAVLIAAAATALLAATGSGLYLALANSDQSQITRILEEFATAVDAQDDRTIIALLCTQEAEGITEDDDYDPTAGPVEAADAPKRIISDIQITGEAATAQIATPGRAPTTIHLRREADQWKVCAPEITP